jgi:release factor glutamine methyltransferase
MRRPASRLPMNDVRAALIAATQTLAATSETPRLDAELLMAHSLETSREAMLLGQLDREVPTSFADLVDRRARREPIAYITGVRDFWTLSLAVTPDVLIPRPDSETLIEAAIVSFAGRAPASILDLGTGSGALLLAALTVWDKAKGLGVDASSAALRVAADNASRLGLADRASFRLGNWGDGLIRQFDLILCNPPYVETGAQLTEDVSGHEPASALFAGVDGLDDYRRLLPQLPGLLAGCGIVALEIGSGQAAAVSALAAASGLHAHCFDDLGGRNRCLVLRKVSDAG